MQKPALIHYILCIAFRLGISLAGRSNQFFHHPRTATAILALLLRLFETVLQGTVCTQTHHACPGHAFSQCKQQWVAWVAIVHGHDNAFFASLPLGCVRGRGKP